MAVDSDLAGVVLLKNVLRACLLLHHQSAEHRYDLRERLRPPGFNRDGRSCFDSVRPGGPQLAVHGSS